MKNMLKAGKRPQLLLLAVLAALLAAGLNSQVAAAALIRCRSDPLVLLSDGTIVDISADIDAPLWTVTRVDYVLHIPAGLQVVLALSTPNWPTTLEHFTVYADTTPGKFVSTTTVYTTGSKVGVTANMLVNTNLGFQSGFNGQPLSITLDPYIKLLP